jgi:hypothetical protein
MEIHWDQISERGWQARLGGPTICALRQDWAFGAMMARYGAKTHRAIITNAGQEVAAAQVLERRGLRVIGQGPVWLTTLSQPDKRRAMRHLARHAGLTFITPQEPLQGWGLVPLITPKSSVIWDISPEIDDLRRGLQGKWRNRLLRAEEVVIPRPLARQDLKDLIANEANTRKVNGYKNLPGNLALDWPAKTLALGWRANGALQAGMVFLQHGASASYFLGWASPLARQSFAHGPVLWQAALALRARGVRLLDLGDVDSEAGQALARFKLGTGAGVQTAGATCLVLPGA